MLTSQRHEAEVDTRIAAASIREARLAATVARIAKAVRKYGTTLHAGYTEAQVAEINAEHEVALHELREVTREYTGWARFFIVQGGHIHSSMNCSTCNNGRNLTEFGWLPELSGLTEADAVAEHGAILCTVCFPSAPVEWTNKYEVEAAARKAARCPGKRDYDKPSRTGYCYGNWGTCDTCGGHIAMTSTGKIRAHKPAERAA